MALELDPGVSFELGLLADTQPQVGGDAFAVEELKQGEGPAETGPSEGPITGGDPNQKSKV